MTGAWSLAGVVIALLVALALAAPRAAASPTAALPTLEPLGQVGGMMAAVATTPDRLLAGEGAALVVYDTASLPLTQVARVPLAAAPQDIAVEGARAYVAAGKGGLQIVGLDAPGPRFLGGAATPGKARGVAASGDYAYVAADLAGLRVFNVATPQAPLEVGHVSSGGRVIALAAKPPYVYLADQNALLAVADVSRPDAPQVVTILNGDARVVDLAVQGDRLYLATNRGLRVMSLADPAQPTEIGRYPAAGYYTLFSLAVRGDVVTVGHYQAGVEEFTISPTGQPAKCADCPSPYPDRSRANVSALAVDAARTYVADGDALRVLAHESGTLPPRLQIVETIAGFTIPFDVAVADGYAYIAAQPTGLAVADLHTAPRVVYRYDLVTPDTAPDVRSVAVTPGALFLTGGDGLVRFDRVDPARPAYRDTLPLGLLTAVTAAGERAFATDGKTVVAARLTDSNALTTTVALTEVRALAASGDTVYAAGDGGLRVVRWPLGGSPADAGGYVAATYRAVAAQGDLVAAVDATGVDLLRAPSGGLVTRVGRYEPAAPPLDVALVGDSLFVLDKSGRVVWLDVRDAAHPAYMAQVAAGGGDPMALAAGGGAVAAVDLTGGLFAWRDTWREAQATLFLPLVRRGGS